MILRQRGRQISRLEAFSDAVFAFSATLLVVSLEVPRTMPELLSGLKGFVAFGLSFAALILIGLGFGLPGWLYGLMGPVGYLHGRWSDRKRPSAGAEEPAAPRA